MDPQRLNRLMELWMANMQGLPQGTNKAPFNEMDPMMAYQALGQIGPAQQQTPMALRFLQLGQQMQPQPDNMIMQLIQALLAPGGMKR
jgi:hypothetical protein